MDIYLVKKEVGKDSPKLRYELKTLIEPTKSSNRLVNKVKDYYHKLEKPTEKALKYACKDSNNEEINIIYSHNFSEEEAKFVYKAILQREISKRQLTLPLNAVLTVTTFVAAPIVPLLN
ncbi:hypothetical protein HY643_04895, partial [Candidatus Woesearchaeota archaeon]|nr:hypothetical protein [Candidatus Woesearchaeota archaeon]